MPKKPELPDQDAASSDASTASEVPGPAGVYDDDFSGRYRKLAHKPKTWLTRTVVVLVPALATAYGSYVTSHNEAENGYKTLAAEVQHQGDAIKAMQADSAEWRKLLVEALLKGSTAAPAVTASPRPVSGSLGHSGGGYGGGAHSTASPVPAPTPVRVPAAAARPQTAQQVELKDLANRPMPPLLAPRKVPDFNAAQHKQSAY